MALGTYDPATIASRWAQNMSSQATQTKIKTSVQTTSKNPMALAASADALARYASACQDSVTSGRRAAALNAVPVSKWKDGIILKGLSRLSSGAQAALSTVQATVAKFAPVWSQITTAVATMPKGTKQQALDRVAASMDALKAAAGKSWA